MVTVPGSVSPGPEGQGCLLPGALEPLRSLDEIARNLDPDLAYILMSQTDDGGHCIGSGWDPSEFVSTNDPVRLPPGCERKPEYFLVSARNRLLFREGIRDAVLDVDIQFGRMIKGLEEFGALHDSTLIFLSDHSAVNHLYSPDFSSTDVLRILEKAGLVKDKNVYAFRVSSYGVLYWRDRKDEIPAAKFLLLKHRAWNPQTSIEECSWWVLDRTDMKNGIKDVCLPGELFHTYFVETDREKSMIWPDLFALAKNG